MVSQSENVFLALFCAEMLIKIVVGAVQVDSIKTRVESAYGVCKRRLNLQHDEMLSNFAFKFNLRRYIVALGFWGSPQAYLNDSWNRLDFMVVILGRA